MVRVLGDCIEGSFIEGAQKRERGGRRSVVGLFRWHSSTRRRGLGGCREEGSFQDDSRPLRPDSEVSDDHDCPPAQPTRLPHLLRSGEHDLARERRTGRVRATFCPRWHSPEQVSSASREASGSACLFGNDAIAPAPVGLVRRQGLAGQGGGA
jgi:hypothetical protein